jgi:hypothetical protein
MSPASTISPFKTALIAAALFGALAAGLAIRSVASNDVPLGALDDYATRHATVAETQLTTADDYGTRIQPAPIELTTADDFGTRNQPAPVELTAADDFGTRHVAKVTRLGLNDDYWTRQQR